MKVPSIFRLPRHQRFEVKPRFYDPVKEDIEERTRAIKKELELERSGKDVQSIRQAYQQRKKASKSADLFQLLMILIIGVALGGWVMYGSNIYFVLLLLIPLYIFLRRR